MVLTASLRCPAPLSLFGMERARGARVSQATGAERIRCHLHRAGTSIGRPALAWPAPCPRVRSSHGRRLLTELGRAIDDPENPPRQLVLTSTKPVFLPKMLLRAGKAPGQAQAHPGRVRALPQGRWPEGDRPCACRGPQGGLTAQGRREVLRLQARLPSGLVTRGQRRGGRGSAVVGGAALRWAGQCRGHASSPEAPAHVALAGREPRALRCGLTSALWSGPVTPLLCPRRGPSVVSAHAPRPLAG